MGTIGKWPLSEGPTVSQLILYVPHGFRETSCSLEEFKRLHAWNKAGHCDWYCFCAVHPNK